MGKDTTRHDGECLIWAGAILNTGYGICSPPAESGLRASTVQRLAYRLSFGDIPEGMEVATRCEHILCVEPTHLLTHPRNKGKRKPYIALAINQETFRTSIEVLESGCWRAKRSRKNGTPLVGRSDAQRLALTLFQGIKVPYVLRIRTTCSFPQCTNPDHLQIGERRYSLKIHTTREEQFLLLVEKDGPVSEYCPELGPCWTWIGRYDDKGYGRFKKQSAHRFSQEHFNEPIPTGMLATHICNNSTCVNPRHLKLGSYKDNVEDAIRAGRIVGKYGPMTPISSIRDILADRTLGLSQAKIAKKRGVCLDTVKKVLKGKMKVQELGLV